LKKGNDLSERKKGDSPKKKKREGKRGVPKSCGITFGGRKRPRTPKILPSPKRGDHRKKKVPSLKRSTSSEGKKKENAGNTLDKLKKSEKGIQNHTPVKERGKKEGERENIERPKK